MGIWEATKKWYKNWGNYKGISEREEYWLGLGGAAIIMCILYGIMRVLQTFSGDLQYLDWLRIASTTSVVVYVICAIITFFAFLCATARRLHDVNKSDWYLLVLLIMDFEFENYLCPVPGQNLSIGGRWGDNVHGYDMLEFHVIKCENTTEKQICHNFEDMELFFKNSYFHII